MVGWVWLVGFRVDGWRGGRRLKSGEMITEECFGDVLLVCGREHGMF